MNQHRAKAGRLPNLLIVGVPKAGTGSLFSYLAQHPDVCASTRKETGYFNAVRGEGHALGSIEVYRGYFAHCRAESYAMEATPSYCYGGPRVISAIRETLDRPRILVTLRDPVGRLWSAYMFQRSLMHLPGIDSFEQYVSACEALRLQGEPIITSGHLKGLAIGFYADYLRQWFEAFPDDVRVIFFEDFAFDAQAVIADLCRWLDIDDAVTDSFDYSARNATVHPRSLSIGKAAFAMKRRMGGVLDRAPQIRMTLRSAYLHLNKGIAPERLHPETRERLHAMYRQSNAATAELLRSRGYERLPAWLWKE
jgi:hypothetical protein